MLKFWTTATASNVWTTHYLKGTTKEVSFDVSQLGGEDPDDTKVYPGDQFKETSAERNEKIWEMFQS